MSVSNNMEIEYIYTGFRILTLVAYVVFMWGVTTDEDYLNKNFRTRGFVKIFGKNITKIVLTTFFTIVAAMIGYSFFL